MQRKLRVKGREVKWVHTGAVMMSWTSSRFTRQTHSSFLPILSPSSLSSDNPTTLMIIGVH